MTTYCKIINVKIFRILEDRISRLHGQLQRLQQFASEGHDLSMDTTYLTVLYEDLHWIILVSSEYINIIEKLVIFGFFFLGCGMFFLRIDGLIDS